MNEKSVKQEIDELKQDWTSSAIKPRFFGHYVIIRKSDPRPQIVFYGSDGFLFDDIVCYYFVPVPPEHFWY